MNKNLLKYRKDYSVYILRAEKKRLGRMIRNNKLNQQEIEMTRSQIKQIEDTLSILKDKYKINYGVVDYENVSLMTIFNLSQKSEKSVDEMVNEMIKQMKNEL